MTVYFQEDVNTPSQKRCEAYVRQGHSQRAERRAQDLKPIDRPPKQAQKKSNRGRKLKNDLRERFKNYLHVTAHVSQDVKNEDDDDELAATAPISQSVSRTWGRPPI